MHYIVGISFGFLLLQLIHVLLNLLFRQRIAHTQKALGEPVSILIPARNEEAHIGNLLRVLSKMKIEQVEILVFDDQSSDNTAQIVTTFSQKDSSIRLLQGGALPEGWLGKNHACYQLAQEAKGSYLLFLDADVKIYGNIVADAVAWLKKKRLGLLSVFPKQLQLTWGEKITVPLMNYILITLLPLIYVRVSPFRSHAAANGQFMLFEAVNYKRLQPHLTCRQTAVEDVAIARYYKRQKIKIACVTGLRRVQCRMYNSYNEALNGFSKNIFAFFGNVPALAFLFWGFAALGWIPLAVAHASYLPLWLLLAVLIQAGYALVTQQNPVTTVLLFPLQLLFMLHVMLKALIDKKRKTQRWKGRNIC